VENYFNYFTEIEERYLKRRGGGLLLSTLDWALIETWKDAGIPLEAVLRGIDASFDKYDQRPSKTRKINSLAFCSQEVLASAEGMKEAAVGAGAPTERPRMDQGFEVETISAFLHHNAKVLESAKIPEAAELARAVVVDAAKTLRELAAHVVGKPATRLEDLERRLTVLEEKLVAAFLTSTPDDEIVNIRAEADRELAPYRRKMSGPQIDQLQKQYLQKQLFEKYRMPRLSLFYM
jgi:hypothetical protein